MQPSPCSETTDPISINDTLLDAPWSESVPFWILLKLVHIKWTKLVQNHQKSLQPSPCSETTEPISINDTPLDAPWSESVPFRILLKLVHIKWTKLVQNHQKSMQPNPCSETTEPISINDTPLNAPWSESVPFWILLKLVHIKWTNLVYVFMSFMSEPVTSYNVKKWNALNRLMEGMLIGRFKALRFLTLYDVTGSDMELMKT